MANKRKELSHKDELVTQIEERIQGLTAQILEKDVKISDLLAEIDLNRDEAKAKPDLLKREISADFFITHANTENKNKQDGRLRSLRISGEQVSVNENDFHGLKAKLQTNEVDISRFNSVKGELNLLEIKFESMVSQFNDLEQQNASLSKEVSDLTEKYKSSKKKLKKEREVVELRDKEILNLKQRMAQMGEQTRQDSRYLQSANKSKKPREEDEVQERLAREERESELQ